MKRPCHLRQGVSGVHRRAVADREGIDRPGGSRRVPRLTRQPEHGPELQDRGRQDRRADRRGPTAGVGRGRRDRRGPRTALGHRGGQHLELPPGRGAVLARRVPRTRLRGPDGAGLGEAAGGAGLRYPGSLARIRRVLSVAATAVAVAAVVLLLSSNTPDRPRPAPPARHTSPTVAPPSTVSYPVPSPVASGPWEPFPSPPKLTAADGVPGHRPVRAGPSLRSVRAVQSPCGPVGRWAGGSAGTPAVCRGLPQPRRSRGRARARNRSHRSLPQQSVELRVRLLLLLRRRRLPVPPRQLLGLLRPAKPYSCQDARASAAGLSTSLHQVRKSVGVGLAVAQSAS